MNDTSDVFSLHRGTGPLLVSLPHVGTEIPAALTARFEEHALSLHDTDWHLEQLYGFAREMGASLIVPRFSRYVVDLNRPPENGPMYPGANNTELCPTRSFEGRALYRAGCEPDEDDIMRRREAYWRPYHEAVADELERIRALHGYALLWDGHSIKSTLPWLFDGKLPDLNLGTAGGTSCAESLRAALAATLAGQETFTFVVNGRFKGGYITRHYGHPDDGIHAVQLEMCWSCYMAEEAPYRTEPERAARLSPVLQALLRTMLAWKPDDRD